MKPKEKINHKRTRLLCWTLAAILSLGLLIAPVITFIDQIGFQDILLEMDISVLELYTLNAAHGEQLLGPYSRFGWNHPGPALFYVFCPLYILSGHKTTSIILTARVFNLVLGACFIMLIIFIVVPTDKHLSAIILVFFSLYYAYLGPKVIAGPWNPFIIITPFLLLIACGAIISTGRTSIMPFAAFLSSFIIQTHIGLTITVIAIGLVSLILLGVHERLGRQTASTGYQTNLVQNITLSLAVLALLWTPPVLEELRNHPGNISKILEYFYSTKIEHSLYDSFEQASVILSWPPLYILKPIVSVLPQFEYELLAQILVIIQAPLILGSIISGFKRSQYLRAYLGIIGIAGTLSAIWALSIIRGGYFQYLILWVSALGFVNWSVIVAWLMEATLLKPGKTTRYLTLYTAGIGMILILLTILLVNGPRFTRLTSRIPGDSKRVEALYNKVAEYIQANRDSRVTVLFNWSGWATQVPVILKLYKDGLVFSVKCVWPKHTGADWPLLLGPDFKPKSDDQLKFSLSEGTHKKDTAH